MKHGPSDELPGNDSNTETPTPATMQNNNPVLRCLPRILIYHKNFVIFIPRLEKKPSSQHCGALPPKVSPEL